MTFSLQLPSELLKFPNNRGAPQGTVLGPTLFSLMVSDIAAISPVDNLLVKYADDMTISAPHRQYAIQSEQSNVHS